MARSKWRCNILTPAPSDKLFQRGQRFRAIRYFPALAYILTAGLRPRYKNKRFHSIYGGRAADMHFTGRPPTGKGGTTSAGPAGDVFGCGLVVLVDIEMLHNYNRERGLDCNNCGLECGIGLRVENTIRFGIWGGTGMGRERDAIGIDNTIDLDEI
ncbi:hypothetical protein EVAR_11406_1 [Eumeta japonica]|uniref:Uncharacterized protein n=1 Tax=Eumeta variegata TaxID=151549 RepID=A0A4C1TN03_EUMVA|nr:hypothetical protein EVAR_11406_1 [Eumeta japonica]